MTPEGQVPPKYLRQLIQHTQRQPGLVRGVVGETLHEGTQPTVPERLVNRMGSRYGIDLDAAKRYVPAWMNPAGVYGLATEITSPAVFNRFLEAAPDDLEENYTRDLFSATERNGNLPLRLTLALTPRTRRSTALLTSGQNSAFVTTELTVGLLAAATGQFADLVRADAIQKQVMIHPTFAAEIGKRYPHPPANAEAYLERVQELLPDPDVTDPYQQGTLLRYMLDHNAFKGPDNLCPAIPLTALMFGQMGKQLATDPEYRARFMRTIQK